MGNSGSFKLGTPAWNKGKPWSEETRSKMSLGQRARPKKTTCKNGHEYTPENTYIRANGWRQCRICQNMGWLAQPQDKKRKKWMNRNAYLKEDVLTHYSPNETLKCSWAGCEVSDVDMLSLDHVDNDGAEHRKTCMSGLATYKWIRRNSYPSGFQTLCFNHQWKKQLTHLRTTGRKRKGGS